MGSINNDEKEDQRGVLPAYDIQTRINHSPHVFILGAGASRACCPSGDRNGRKLPLMNDLVTCLGIDPLVQSLGFDPDVNFETLFSDLYRKGETEQIKKLEEATRVYFSALRIPESPTIYDFLLLTLREKDLIATFNWDPLLPQAYMRCREITNRLPRIVFLHGNVAVGIDRNQKTKTFWDERELHPSSTFEPSPLLFPIEKKSYNDDAFIKSEWDEAARWINHAYLLTFFGYSAPKTDVEARELLLNALQKNRTRKLAYLDFIDIANTEAIEANWREFLITWRHGIGDSYWQNYTLYHPRRSCEAFAFATLQQDPWKDDPIPRFSNFDEIKKWIQPYNTEEEAKKFSGRPLSKS